MTTISIKALSLYSTPASGCSARVRTVMNLKSAALSAAKIPVTHHSLSLSRKAENSVHSQTYLAINPNASVPTLVVEYEASAPPFAQKLDYHPPTKRLTITQSPAILDLLESNFPLPTLLPPTHRPKSRALTLSLSSLIACDIQPPQNLRVRQKITSQFGGDSALWAKDVYERGFGVYEELVKRGRLEGVGMGGLGKKGRYSVGDEITWADCFLVPAVQGSLKVGVELERWPVLKNIVENCWEMEAFRKGGLEGHGRLMP